VPIDEEILYRYIGKRLKEVREAREGPLTQEILSVKVGLKRTSITNIELGIQRPPINVLYEICDVLGVEPAIVLPTMDYVRTATDFVYIEVNGKTYRMTRKTAEFVAKKYAVEKPTKKNKS
jgi:transcriptional regulator with XRE-family HTH domain